MMASLLRMEDAQFLVQWDEHPTHLATRLGYLLEHQSLVDVTLMCNTHTLKVHRAVLAACSPYFERQLGNHPLIVLKDMKFSVLKSLVEFMYCGETSVSEENLTPLLEAAKFFEVKGLAAMTKETVCLPNASHSSKSVNGTSSTSGYNRGSGRGRGRGRGRPPLNPSSKIGSPTESAQILLSLSGNSQATGNQQFLTTSKNVKIDPSSVLSDKKGYEPRRRGRRRGALNSAFREKLLREADTLAIESLKRDLSEDGESPLLTSLLSKPEKPVEPRPDDSKYLQTLKEFGLPTNVPILLDNGEGKLVTLTEDVLKSVMDSDGNVQFHVAEETDPPKNSILNNKKLKQSDDESDPNVPIKTEPEDTINETILESLRNGAASEAEQDPEAVVLFEVTGDKKVEKYVVSAKEVNALKTLNEQLAKQKKQLADMTKNNVSTIDVVGTNTKVAELKLKIGKTKSVLSQVMECAQHGLREKLKSYTSEQDEKKPQSQVLELEFIDGNGEKIEGYQVEGTVVGKRVNETKENDLLGLFDMSSLDEKESKPLLTTDETKDMSYQLVMNNHLEEHNENIPYDQIEAMIGETESNIVIDHKNQYIIGNGENMMNHDDNYVQDMSGGEYVIYGNSDSVLPDMDGESADNFVQNEFIVYGEEEEKTGLKIDGVETEAQYIVYTSEEKTDNTEKDEFVIYPPGKENRGSDKEVPLAVGLVPLKDALHKLQTMSDHQPRRTRSNSSSDQPPCHPTKRRSSLSSSEPDRIDKKLRPDPADPL